jgi:DNA ligase (NAD+)
VPRDQLQAAYERFARARPTWTTRSTGWCTGRRWLSEHARLGLTGHHPRYAIAYKFQGDSGHTALQDVLWSVSRTGTITPVALLEPVELRGDDRPRQPAQPQHLRGARLTHGCRVEVTRRGGVIPNVERVIEAGPHGGPFPLPTHCPACGGPGAAQARSATASADVRDSRSSACRRASASSSTSRRSSTSRASGRR